MASVRHPAPLFVFFFLLSLAVTTLSLDTIVLDQQSKNLLRMPLASAIGPESITFDPAGRGPYTTVSDGRVLRWDSQLRRWAQFAVSPRKRGVTAAMCTGTSDPAMEPKCGRPLGLQFHRASGHLYIADAYYGLLVVGPGGGFATAVATSAEGVPFNLTNGVDIDQDTGIVYFTDSSTDFQRSSWLWSILMGDSTGRFMSYDPRTKQVKVLLRGLQFPNGVAVSADNAFVVLAESTKRRILRYWIKGPKMGTMDVFATMAAFPDNVKKAPGGGFWVGVNLGKGKIQSVDDGQASADVAAMKFDAAGSLVGVLDDREDEDALSEVEERNGTLYLGSVVAPYLGMYKLMP